MGVILKLAINNLLQHKSKTIIIGAFIAVGMLVIQLGNGFLESVNKGMEKDFRANYTGDIIVSCQIPQSVQMDLFGKTDLNDLMGSMQLLSFPQIEEADKIIDKTKGIAKKTRIVSTNGILMNSNYEDFQLEDQDTNKQPVAYIFAGQKETYFDMFSNMKITEGRKPAFGTNEILVDEKTKENYFEYYGEELKVGSELYFKGIGSTTIIRPCIVCGFYKQPDENSSMSRLIYADPSFARTFAGLTYGASFAEDLPESIDTSYGSASEEDMFGSDDDMFEFEDMSIVQAEKVDFDSILGDTSLRDKLNQTDDGSWNYILLRTEKPKDAEKIIEELNKSFAENNINAVARDWKAAANSYASSVNSISSIFTALVVILSIVVFIIIMNTMVISVLERTGEIGTMRAIGAEKRFVRKLFFYESISLTLISEFIGIVLALLMMLILNACHFTVGNEFAKVLIGGGSIAFIPTVKSFLGTMIALLIGTILANLYPVASALKITPLKALSKGND